MYVKIIDFFRKNQDINTQIANKVVSNMCFVDLSNELIVNNNISIIPKMFWYLVSSNLEKKDLAIKCLSTYLKEISFSQLTKLDKVFRERTSINWAYDWQTESPKILLNKTMNDEEKCYILGLASFHPNGYFREKAIKELTKLNSGKELTYLLIRCNDWVEEVRNITKKGIEIILKESNTKIIIKNLPLIYRLKNLFRNDNSRIFDSCVFAIKESKEEDLIYGLKFKDSMVRLYSYIFILENNLLENFKLVLLALDEKVPYIRKKVVSSLVNGITKEQFDIIRKQLSKDKYFYIRKIYLELLNKFYGKKSRNIIKNFLFDDHTSVREVARYILKDTSTLYAEMYKDALDKNMHVFGAIQGLGEVGVKGDSKYIEKYLCSSKTKVVRVAIKSIFKLNGDIETLIQYLKDERVGVSKDVRNGVINFNRFIEPLETYNIYKESNLFHVKKNSTLMLFNLTKWTSISYILEIMCNEKGELARMAKQAFYKWNLNFNNNFSVPSNSELKSILTKLDEFKKGIKQEDYNWLKFVLKPYISESK